MQYAFETASTARGTLYVQKTIKAFVPRLNF